MPIPGTVSRPIKRRLRRAVDRVMAPYVVNVGSAVAPEPLDRADAPVDEAPVDEATVSTRFHMTNHTLRELELERLRGRWNRVLSVGANGAWYFDWFRQAVGDVDEHIGLEAYVAKPDDLPPYVTWIANNANQMDDVDDASVDLVFGGQVSEHMWPEELAGFLSEAHRVLRPGGVLALDSPNRIVTEHLHWSHGEHTIEIDPDEISELLGLAGFDVSSVAGLWRCRFGGRIWQLEEGIDTPEILTRRVLTGRDHPADSFCWWVNAERAERAVDRAGLDVAVESLFTKHWNTRVSRGFFPAVGAALPVAAGSHDRIAATLPFPLRAGRWRVALRLAGGSWDSVDALRLAFVAPGGQQVHVGDLANAQRAGSEIHWVFEQPHLLFALVAQLDVSTRADLNVAFPLEVTPL